MLRMKVSIAVVMIAILMVSGVTAVQAAAGSLPGQAIYPIKIAVEDVQELFTKPSEKAQQSMQRVENRIQEIIRLQALGEPVPQGAITQLQNQLEETLRYMLMLNDDELKGELVQVRNQLMVQERLVLEFQNQGQSSENSALERVRTMLQNRLQLFDDGQTDPEQFRSRIRDRYRDRSAWESEDEPPSQGQGLGGYGPGPAENEGTPGSGSYGPGEGQEGQPEEPGAYGPGYGSNDATPTPGSFGPGPGEATPTPGPYGPDYGQYGATPTPGEYGPGSGGNP